MATGSSISSYFEAQILNWLKGTSIVAAPATVYVALYTARSTSASVRRMRSIIVSPPSPSTRRSGM